MRGSTDHGRSTGDIPLAPCSHPTVSLDGWTDVRSKCGIGSPIRCRARVRSSGTLSSDPPVPTLPKHGRSVIAAAGEAALDFDLAIPGDVRGPALTLTLTAAYGGAEG